MSEPEFWEVIAAFDLSKVQRTQALALMQAKLAQLMDRPQNLSAEDGAWLDRAARWTGITREIPQAVAIASAAGGDLHARILARADELAHGIQEELGLVSPVADGVRGEPLSEKRVANSNDSAVAVAVGGAR